MAKRPNPLRLDPTRTTVLRRQFMAEMHKRFRTLRGEINKLIIDDDAFGLAADKAAGARGGGLAAVLAQNTTQSPAGGSQGSLVANQRWRFDTDAGKVQAYRDWLKERVDAGILEVSPGNAATPWLEPYVGSAYKRGVVRSYQDTNAARIAAASEADFGFYEGGKAEFLRTAFNAPTAQSKVQQLSTRAFSQLQGVTAAMDQEMTRILSDGLTAGKGPRELARSLNKTVGKLEKRRALTIARTELVHAHAEGQLDSFETLGVEELGVMAEWNTAHDDLVCPLCQPMEGVVLTTKEARGMIPRHPNCRCAWVPAGVGEHDGGTTKTTHAGQGQGLSAPGTVPTGKTTGQVWSKDERVARIRDSIKAENPKLPTTDARKKSRWVGADLTTVAGKLKPGSKAWQAAQATAQRSKAARQAQGVLAAKAAERQAQLEASYNAKLAQTKTKYGLQEDDLYVAKHNGQQGATNTAMKAHAQKAGATLGQEDIVAIKTAASKAPPSTPLLQAQMEALDQVIEKAVAKQAVQAERAAKKAHSAKVKIGMAKKKYGITDEHLSADGGSLGGMDKMSAWAQAKHGVPLDTGDVVAWADEVVAAAAATPNKPTLVVQLEALDKIAKAKSKADPAIVAKSFAKAQQEATAATPPALQSLKVKAGMAKKKYGLDDTEVYSPNGVGVQLDKNSINSVAEKRGVYLTPEEVKQVRYTIPATTSDLQLTAQMDAIDAIKLQHAKAKMPPGKAAIHKTKTEDAVLGWTDDVPATTLDDADYSSLPGWGPASLPAGKTQSYGVLLFDDEGRILLRQPKGNFGGAHWTFAKGGGSKPGTTALAELAEETGHKGAIHDVLPGGHVGSTTKTNYFLGKSKGYDASLMDQETAGMKWMSYDEAKEAIASSTAEVAARDLKVLEDAFDHLHKAGGGATFKALKESGQQAAQAKAAAVHSNKVKVGMAKKHFEKDKFGGGVQPEDWVPGKDKLQSSGVDKVLGEKGWSLQTLPGDQAKALLAADDVLAQKALMEQLKKAPKGTPTPVQVPVPTPVQVPVPGKPILAGPVQKHVDDVYWDKTQAAAKTIGTHYKDGGYNATTMSAWRSAIQEAKHELKDAVDPHKRAMLQHYIDAFEELDRAANLGVAPKNFVKQFEYQPTYAAPKVGEVVPVPGGGINNATTFEVTNSSIGGSTGAKLVEVGSFKSKYVMKEYSGRGIQAENEFLANGIYNQVAPGSAPKSVLGYVDNGGKTTTAVFNEFVEGGQEIGKLTGTAKTAAAKQAKDNFVLDAWLANWDAVGMGGDNMMVAGGKVVRIDNGGALLFRAQGGLKGKQFGNEVAELKTLLDSSTNPNAAKVYKGITDKEIAAQIEALEDKITAQGGISKFLDSAGIGQISDAAKRAEIEYALTQRFNNLTAVRDKIEGLSRVPLPQRWERIKEVAVPKQTTETVTDLATANARLTEVTRANKITGIQEVRNFTGSSYTSINREHVEAARKGLDGKRAKSINKALAKLPGWEGTLGRGRKNVPDSHWENWKRGTWAQDYWACPSSTTARPSSTFGSSSGVCYIIRSKGKRNGWVMDISNHRSEHEALMMGETRFRVRGWAEGGGNHQRYLVVDELDIDDVAPATQAAPPQLDGRELWEAFENDAARAGISGGKVDGPSVTDLINKAQSK